MQARLLVNRHGKLATAQWKELVMEPVVGLLLLVLPALFILGPRLLAFAATGAWLGLALVAVLAVMLGLRARRYARLPLHAATLYTGASPRSGWAPWRADVLYTEAGEALRFRRWLAPRLRLRANRAYLVYYLREDTRCVLLSLAPADHPEAESWRPGPAFHDRHTRRLVR
jgi:hypothetical protein